MDLVNQKFHVHESAEAFSPLTSPPSSLFGKPVHSSHASFPIIAVAIIGILATGFLLVSYYIFVIKCCLNWHRIDLLRRFSFSRTRRVEDPLMVHSPAAENRGLEEAVIRSIPIFKYKKSADEDGERSICAECAVCLNDFQENEKLRSIPNCGHIFHIDCIDVWLQNNANCPLCRNSISIPMDHHHRHYNQIIMCPSSSPQNPNPYRDNFAGRDEDYVVIEIAEQNHHTNQPLLRVQERLNNTGDGSSAQPTISPSPRKLPQPKLLQKKAKKFNHISSMGDECIDIRHKDENFAVQPIRRSFSMDSASDRQLYLAVQEIVQQQRQLLTDVSPSEGCSNRVKRSFFSFGHGRGSRSAVLPVHMEL